MRKILFLCACMHKIFFVKVIVWKSRTVLLRN